MHHKLFTKQKDHFDPTSANAAAPSLPDSSPSSNSTLKKQLPIKRPESQFFDLGYSASAVHHLTEVLGSGYCGGHSTFVQGSEELLSERLRCFFGLVCNGTVALELALRVAGVTPGQMVAVSARSFVATANAILSLGGIPVFVDQSELGIGMCPDSLKRTFATYPEIRTVVVAHLYGSAPTIGKIHALCADYQKTLIEDAAQGFGTSVAGRPLGTWGRMGTFSFFSNKVLSCGEGGGVAFASEDDNQLFREIRYHGGRINDSGEFVESRHGTNARMGALQAALLFSQLQTVDQHLQYRSDLARSYQVSLSGVSSLVELAADEAGRPLSLWCAVLRRKGGRLWDPQAAKHLARVLCAHDIACRPGMPWLSSLPHLRQFQEVKANPGERGIELLCPLHPGMDNSSVERVVEDVNRVILNENLA